MAFRLHENNDQNGKKHMASNDLEEEPECEETMIVCADVRARITYKLLQEGD